MADELIRAKRKLLAIRRAERRLKHRLEDIDYEIDILMPEVEILALEATKRGEIPQFLVEDED